MTTWHYAYTKHPSPTGPPFWTITEVYRDQNGDLSAWSSTVNAMGETPFELRDDLKRMLDAINYPWLDLTTDPPTLNERQ